VIWQCVVKDAKRGQRSAQPLNPQTAYRILVDIIGGATMETASMKLTDAMANITIQNQTVPMVVTKASRHVAMSLHHALKHIHMCLEVENTAANIQQTNLVNLAKPMRQGDVLSTNAKTMKIVTILMPKIQMLPQCLMLPKFQTAKSDSEKSRLG